MRESTSFKITKPIIIICVLLIAGSIVGTSFSDVDSTNESEVLNESVIRENAQQAMQAQFYENLGQVQNGDIRFYSEVSGLGIGFTDSSVIYRLSSLEQDTTQMDKLDIIESESISESIFITLSFEGANVVTPQGHGLLSHTSNYFIGNNPDQWFTGIRSFGEIVYPDLYDNIDLIYRSSEEGLKYEFVVWPGGNPADIKLRYEGIENLAIDDGSLIAETSLGSLVDRNLYIYQNIQSSQKEIAGKFALNPDIDCSFRFQIDAEYHEDLPLIIDPFLHYSTYVGGSTEDRGSAITLDSSNNAYVTGWTSSTNFPTTPGANDTIKDTGFDIYILKLSADGSTLLYSTFVGGSSNDHGHSIALDSSNNAYVTGYSGSSDFPTTPGAYNATHGGSNDVFILKLSADGSALLYSTFVGGSQYEYSYSIALDSSNNAYITGATASPDFPTTPGANDTSANGIVCDAFILKMSADGSTLLYSTFVGGDTTNYGYSIVLDSSNNAYVTGYTDSSDFPTTTGANDTTHNNNDDVFILKLSADGTTLLYSTFVGGGDNDRGNSIALDSFNNAYVTGYTESSDFLTTPGANDTSHNGLVDVFILKLSADGSTLLYSTFVGGSSNEYGMSIALDSSNNAYVTGYSSSSDFPTTSDANDTGLSGVWDAFILKLSSDGSNLLYSTYVGGSLSDFGSDITLDSSDNAYITGNAASSDFPTTSGAYNTTYSGGVFDVFIIKVDIRGIHITIESPISAMYGDNFITVDYTIDITPIYPDSTVLVYFDGISNVTAFPSGSLWSSLSDGSHNLTLVTTTQYEIASETVIFYIDTTSPDLDSPMDITYVIDSDGNYIHWTVGDWSPGLYMVEGNGSTIGLTAWSENGTISFNIDGLVVGFIYNHTITVYDEFGYSAIDSVFVRVIERTDINSPLDVVIELGTTGHSLTWTIGSSWWPLPSYRIDGNGTTIDWTACTDQTIMLSIDGLGLGTYNFTISLIDEYDYMVSDTVFVTVVDTTPPEIDSPMARTYEEGETGNSITWSPSDLNPDSYEIFRNGISIDSGSWNGSIITIDVDGLDAGTYNYIITVADSSGNTVSDTVTVIVTALTSTTTSTTPTTTTDTATDPTAPTGDNTMLILGVIGAGNAMVIVVVLLLFRGKQS